MLYHCGSTLIFAKMVYTIEFLHKYQNVAMMPFQIVCLNSRGLCRITAVFEIVKDVLKVKFPQQQTEQEKAKHAMPHPLVYTWPN